MLAAGANAQVIAKPKVIRVPGRAIGVVKPRGTEATADTGGENVFVRPERDLLKKLSESRKLISAGRFGEAVRNLDAILEGREDYFIAPDKKSSKSCGIKAEAERLIGRMPREGRDLYELQYGTQARKALDEALEASDAASLTAGLSAVSRQFFHTRSGYQATFLLGLHYFDRGDAMLAARTLQRLDEAGEAADEFEPALSLTMAAAWIQADLPDRAREVLVALRRDNPSLRVKVAGRETPIFSKDGEALDWLAKLTGARPARMSSDADRWLTFRGDACRNATMVGGAPLLNMRWRVLSTENPQEEKELARTRKEGSEYGEAAIPAFHPLAVGNVVLMRTLESLLAVDVTTGKLQWEVPFEEPEERTAGDATSSQRVIFAQQALLAGGNKRITSDLTYGTLSSDGRYVFSVEDAGPDTGATAGGGRSVIIGGGRLRVGGRIVIVNRGNNDEQTPVCNLLAAHDIRTGKLKWQIGGPSGPHALPMAGHFFLGPPLPLQSRLYVLAEDERVNAQEKGTIRLLALDAASGDMLWSQQLANSDAEGDQDPSWRQSGVSPSYADGVLVCPTGAGAIVGVDLTTRSLLWGYCFASGGNENRRNAGMFLMPRRSEESSASQWLDDSLSICSGRVVTTPDDSDWLYCVGLYDGELIWKCPRKDDLYVACVDRDKVVLVGKNAVRAVQLSDGKPAWEGRAVSLPTNSTPSGRGFVSGNRYFLPLTSAEIVGIELTAGKIVQTAKSRKGMVPGNLVCFKGNVVSQGVEGVDAYYQLETASAEVERRLAANQNDAEALSLRGEILLDKGERAAAIASFVSANELEGNPRTRELLRDTILEGLRSDFPAYRKEAWRYERLADDASQRAAFFRAMGVGLRQSGDVTAAFGYYEKLADLEPQRRPLDEINRALFVRRDRWLYGQLEELRRDASGDAAEKIDQSVAARMIAAKAGSLDGLRRFVGVFGSQPDATSARTELIRRLDVTGRRLESELATMPTGDDVNVRQTKPADSRDAEWPSGAVEAKTAKANNGTRNSYGRGVLSLKGSCDPFFRDVSLQYDFNRRLILAYDKMGGEMWQVSLNTNGQQPFFGYNSSMNHGRAVGHLLLVSFGWRVLAIDTLGEGSKGRPRVLWTKDVMGQPLESTDGAPLPQVPQPTWQQQRQFSLIHDQSKLLNLVRPGYMCLQRFHSVAALDPRTGETLWSRQDMPFGCDLWGDDEYVFVLPPDTNEAMVLRAWDGQTVGKRRVPRIIGGQSLGNGVRKEVFGRFEESCLATLGRKMLLWWPVGKQRELTLVDPLEGRDLWRSRKFSNNASTCVVNDEVIGVMEPSGHLTLISTPDGRTIADLKLKPEPSLSDISLDVSDHQYLLLTNSTRGETHAQHFQPMPGSSYRPIYSGRLYAIDRQGKLQWRAPAVIRNQYLATSQPSGVPVVTFASQIYQQRANGQSRNGVSVLCIDKRTGRTVFQDTFDKMTGLFEIMGNAEKKTVSLTMQQVAVTLTFTDKPIPPPSAAKTEPEKKQPKKSIRALWDSVQKVLGQGDDETGREGE